MKEQQNKFIIYKDLKGSYKWRLSSPTGETLADSPSGHQEKSACEVEVRAYMADHPDAGVLDATSRGDLRRIHQAVEKVGIELIATTNRARIAPKSAYLVPGLE